jgi:starch-binding outer membrane protein, SusD/RagB family
MKNTMKNKFIILIVSAVLVFSQTSCTDWLEEQNFTQIGSEYIYESEQGLIVGLGGLYNMQRSYEKINFNSNLANLWLYCADDLANTRTFNDAQIYKANMTPAAMPGEKWSAGYQLIDRASAIISGSSKISMPAAVKDRILGEAKVIRAMTYFKLIQLYDNILIDTVATTTENAFDKVEYKPASKEEVYKLINADLDFAIAKLPYNVKPGQVGKALARHLRAQTAAWNNDWESMATQCDDIISNSGLFLQPIDKVFGQDQNHKESIYTYQFDEILGTSDNLAGGGDHHMPAYFNARYYEMPGGYMIEDNAWGGNCFAWSTPNKYLKSLYDKDLDKRYTNYFYPEIVIGNKPGTAFYGKPLPTSSYSDNLRQYGFSLKKYQDFNKPSGRAGSYKDIMAYRLAETLLLGAEAHWRKSNDPKNPKALEYINKVRARAGVPNLESVSQDIILDESARELCFEGGRWFLLKRMGVLVERVNKYHTFGSASTNIVATNMLAHQVRWPIPQVQITLMGGTFPQNTGY